MHTLSNPSQKAEVSSKEERHGHVNHQQRVANRPHIECVATQPHHEIVANHPHPKGVAVPLPVTPLVQNNQGQAAIHLTLSEDGSNGPDKAHRHDHILADKNYLQFRNVFYKSTYVSLPQTLMQ